jgi:hypothetical protein
LRRLPAQTTTPRLPWGSLSWGARPRESVKFRGERPANTVRPSRAPRLAWAPLGSEGQSKRTRPLL